MLQHSPHCNLATLLLTDMSAPAPRIVRLEQILPWNSTHAMYDNAAACFLSMRDYWASCPCYHREVTEWLCVYQGIWVRYLRRYVLLAETNFHVAECCCNNCPIRWRSFAQRQHHGVPRTSFSRSWCNRHCRLGPLLPRGVCDSC
jgi:hypothetical protein